MQTATGGGRKNKKRRSDHTSCKHVTSLPLQVEKSFTARQRMNRAARQVSCSRSLFLISQTILLNLRNTGILTDFIKT